MSHSPGKAHRSRRDPTPGDPGSAGSTSPTFEPRLPVSYENRKAAAVLKQSLASRSRVDQTKDLGHLPDIGSLKIAESASLRRKEMSKAVTFSGKPSQLEDTLTYCSSTLAADGVTDEARKAGTLASLLRGPALKWYTTESEKSGSTISTDYGELKAQLRQRFGITESAKKLQAAKKLSALYQKKAARDYAFAFEELASDAGLNEETKIAFFTKGLKPKIREALILKNEDTRYKDIVDEATRMDTELYYASSHNRFKNQAPNKRGKDGKFKRNPVKDEF